MQTHVLLFMSTATVLGHSFSSALLQQPSHWSPVSSLAPSNVFSKLHPECSSTILSFLKSLADSPRLCMTYLHSPFTSDPFACLVPATLVFLKLCLDPGILLYRFCINGTLDSFKPIPSLLPSFTNSSEFQSKMSLLWFIYIILKKGYVSPSNYKLTYSEQTRQGQCLICLLSPRT